MKVGPQNYECTLCGAVAADHIEATRRGWDWFRCYLPRRFVACEECQQKHPAAVEQARENAGVRRELHPEKPLVSKRIILP